MPCSTRTLSILLAMLSFAGCDPGGSGDDESEPEPCPATGDPLLPQLPHVLPAYTDGCEDSTWATTVDEAKVAWTIELEGSSANGSMVVVPSESGVVAITGREARWVTSAGEVLFERDLGSSPGWNRVGGFPDGRLVVVGASGAAPFYRVLDTNGSEIWLRLLDSSFGQPSLWIDGNDVLLGVLQFSDVVELRIERWQVTGSKTGTLTLANANSDAFVRDGAGRYAVSSGSEVQIYASDGAPLGTVSVGFGEYPFVVQIAGAMGAEGGFFAAGGDPDPFVSRITVAGQAEVAWTTRIGDPSVTWEYASSLAALPDGGVVIVGGESKIRMIWPMSPLTNSIQPFVLALDAEGQPTWGERIGAPGQALAVGLGPEGEVYVGGTAQSGPPNEYGSSTSVSWLRRYDLP